MLQHAATCCNTLYITAIPCSTWHGTATQCNTLQHAATHCNTLQRSEMLNEFFASNNLLFNLLLPATRCNILQHNAKQCSKMQHTATHCNTLQHTATQRDVEWALHEQLNPFQLAPFVRAARGLGPFSAEQKMDKKKIRIEPDMNVLNLTHLRSIYRRCSWIRSIFCRSKNWFFWNKTKYGCVKSDWFMCHIFTSAFKWVSLMSHT